MLGNRSDFAHVGMLERARCSVRTPQRGVPTQRTMHHQIGIPPDGTGEVQIIGFGQTIMAEWPRIVARPFEAFEQPYLQRLLFRLSVNFSKQSLQFGAMRQIANFIIKTERELTV